MDNHYSLPIKSVLSFILKMSLDEKNLRYSEDPYPYFEGDFAKTIPKRTLHLYYITIDFFHLLVR